MAGVGAVRAVTLRPAAGGAGGGAQAASPVTGGRTLALAAALKAPAAEALSEGGVAEMLPAVGGGAEDKRDITEKAVKLAKNILDEDYPESYFSIDGELIVDTSAWDEVQGKATNIVLKGKRGESVSNEEYETLRNKYKKLFPLFPEKINRLIYSMLDPKALTMWAMANPTAKNYIYEFAIEQLDGCKRDVSFPSPIFYDEARPYIQSPTGLLSLYTNEKGQRLMRNFLDPRIVFDEKISTAEEAAEAFTRLGLPTKKEQCIRLYIDFTEYEGASIDLGGEIESWEMNRGISHFNHYFLREGCVIYVVDETHANWSPWLPEDNILFFSNWITPIPKKNNCYSENGIEINTDVWSFVLTKSHIKGFEEDCLVGNETISEYLEARGI
ncbi:hypothetical protein OAJ27_01055 [bacterium]|nr:hypothetical protein [bacterium]